MLTALRIGNFKAFADTQRVPIRPLTFLYGANSAGKSSIIHGLVLARHVLDTGELDIHRTVVGGESVDLGGFRQYVHRREVGRRMEWSMEIDVASLTGRVAELLAPVRRAAVTVAIGIALDDQGRPTPGATPQVHAYEIEADGASLLRMSRRPHGNLQLDRLEHEHPVFREVLRAIVETATTAESFQPSDFEGLHETIEALVPEIVARATGFLPEQVRPEARGGEAMLFPVSRGRRREDLAAAVRFFLPRTLDDLMRGLGEAIGAELSRVRYLGPLRSYPPRHLAFAQHHDPNWFAGGGYAWDVVRRDEQVRAAVNAWLSAPDRLQTRYELVIRDLVGIDQLEAPLLEGLESLGDRLDVDYEPDDEGATEAVPVIRDPEAEVARLRETIRLADLEKLSELILVDRRSNTVVSHRDVGIGVSQVLPVLVSAYAAEGQILAIEQPEIHLHPALQSDLGDVFIGSALGGQRNRFLIESHSEHLLLRVMRRMRETAQQKLDGRPAVKPEDVAVLYLQRDGARSTVLELRLDDEGVLLDPWPGGFFEEGFRERFP